MIPQSWYVRSPGWVKRFRGWRMRALRTLLGKTPTGRALLVTEWMRGFDTGMYFSTNRQQRRAAIRRATRRR